MGDEHNVVSGQGRKVNKDKSTLYSPSIFIMRNTEGKRMCFYPYRLCALVQKLHYAFLPFKMFSNKNKYILINSKNSIIWYKKYLLSFLPNFSLTLWDFAAQWGFFSKYLLMHSVPLCPCNGFYILLQVWPRSCYAAWAWKCPGSCIGKNQMLNYQLVK